MKPSSVLRLAAVVDFILAVAIVGTPFVRSRVGIPIASLVAAVIASGSVVLLVLASQFDRR